MKKPAAKAQPATRTAAARTPVRAQAVPAAKRAAVAAKSKKPAGKAAVKAAAPAKAVKAPQAVSPAKKTASARTAAAPSSPSPTPAGRKAASTGSPMPQKKAAAASSAPSPATATPPAAAVAATPPPARGGRVSRLSQLTVPSMPQAVASTAAKASFTQIMSTAIVPPPPVAVKKDPKLANNWKTKSPEELTDAEVIAMPDGEYMNDKQMAFFRLKLLQLKQGILENAGETTEHLREDTVVVPDPADRATIEEEHALELRTRDRERKLLKKIEQSIARIDAGDYGYCDETGEPIGVGRLLARPTATLSLEAQQRRELKQKMFGD